MNRSLELSIKLWTENPKLSKVYAKALSNEFKKPVKDQRPAHEVARECLQGEKNEKTKWLSTTLLFLVAFYFFPGCDGTEILTEPIINALEKRQTNQYTGLLHRIGSVERFGSGANDPMALEWNGIELYMIAEHGYYPSEGEYLFTVDRTTGAAKKVNPGARDFGGSFTQGRTFTQVKGVSPNDLAWNENTDQMFGVCFVIDAIVSMDVFSGFAGRIGGKLSYCLENDQRIPQGRTLGYNGLNFYMSATTNNLLGEKIIELSLISGNFQCSTPIAEIRSIALKAVLPVAMCWDGEQMYMSEKYSQSLSILDLQTGELTPIAKWSYTKLPPGHYIQDKHTALDSGLTKMPITHNGKNYHYVNRAKNVGFDFPNITGIAFDGQNMYAVDYFTDALYKISKK